MIPARDGTGGSRALPKPIDRTTLVLQLLEELAGRAGDVDSARDAAFAVFYALDDARGLAALGAIGALGGVHDLLAVCGFCDLRHFLLLKSYRFFPQAAAVPMSTGVEVKREAEAEGRG